MILTFVGTGSGKTSLNRFHSSILISTSKTNLLVDAGDGISKALLKRSIRYNKINGVLFTHFHSDHYSGFASLIVQMKMSKRSNVLNVFVHHSLIDVLKNFLLTSYIFPEQLGFEINFISVSENQTTFADKELSFRLFPNSHLAELSQMKKYSDLSYFSGSVLFNIGNKKIFYSSDIGANHDLLIPEFFGSDIFIVEVTHLSAKELKTIITRQSPKIVYFIHISDDQEESLKRIQKTIQKSSGIVSHITKDGLILKI